MASVLFPNNTQAITATAEKTEATFVQNNIKLQELQEKCESAVKKLQELESIKSLEKFKVIETAYENNSKVFESVRFDLDNRMKDLEAKITGGGGGGIDQKEAKPTVYIKAKDQVPEKMDADVLKWKAWKSNFLSYADTLRPGMKKWLNDIERLPHNPRGTDYSDETETWKTLDKESL